MDDGLQGLTPVEPRALAGIMPNRQHQTFHGFMKGAPYELAVVEFDDQGRCYDRGQMDGVAQRLEALAPDNSTTGEDVILVVFVHGWQHDARTDDDNLTAFRALLSKTVEYEKRHASAGVAPRPVLGVFVGWRAIGFRLGRRRRGCDLLDPAGGRATGCGGLGAGIVRAAATLSQSAAKARRKPAARDRRP